MPRPKHLVTCGGAERQDGDRKILKLDLHGATRNVRLQISDISRPLLVNLPDVLIDLLEVASYVYAADSATSRGGETDGNMGEWWRRDFRFVIPVRDPDLWSSIRVVSALIETLNFLSDDQYAFEFFPLTDPPSIRTYFNFPDTKGSTFRPDEIILFSGGMDSFAGTVEELAITDKKIALVSHQSATTIAGVQRHLVNELRNRFGNNRILHVPVRAHVLGKLGQEPTHRTRSFLFAALGAVTAQLFRKERSLIFENGVVSLNLPLVAQVVGARATRTTHPQALAGFRRVISEIFGHPFRIENPFCWLTKTEVVGRITANGCGDLIRHTRSCTRIREMTRQHSHCGQCSQCLDRRLAILAAKQADEDPEEAYRVDFFTGERPPGPDREVALAFIRSAILIRNMSNVEFFMQYGETSRIIGYYYAPADTVARQIFTLYRRHAGYAFHVFGEAISARIVEILDGSLPPNCLLSLVIAQRGGTIQYATPAVVPERSITEGADIQISVDETGNRVVFDRWGVIGGASAQLLVILAASYRDAVRNERAPKNFPFIRGKDLSRRVRGRRGGAQEACIPLSKPNRKAGIKGR